MTPKSWKAEHLPRCPFPAGGAWFKGSTKRLVWAMPFHGSASSPACVSCHCIHLCVFIDQLYWTEFDSEHSVAISYKSGHSLMRREEHFVSGCMFRTGSECLISSVISSTSDPLSPILISFVPHLTSRLEALWIRYWLCYSVFIWDSSKNQTKPGGVSVGLGH